MCKLSPYFAEFMYRCANAWLMCKCANVRMCKLSPYFAEFMYRCANAWLMCKCANVRMCKLSPYFAEFMYRCANVRMFFVNARTKATICTFAHSHICTLPILSLPLLSFAFGVAALGRLLSVLLLFDKGAWLLLRERKVSEAPSLFNVPVGAHFKHLRVVIYLFGL